MGFSSVPPKPTVASILETIRMAVRHSDQALILTEPPWDSLLVGVPADRLIRNNQLGIANYYRGLGIQHIVVSIDPTNGLDRSSDSDLLKNAGHSLTEFAVQQIFRDYAVAMDSIIHPEDLGLASETNLVRLAAPSALYNAEVQAANAAAADVRAIDPTVRLFATVQVEVAWGRLGSMPGPYVGIAQDRADFSFADRIGLSSYPYLGGFAEPESLPADYYSRLAIGGTQPLMVIEGGWPSVSVGPAVSSPDKQRRYINRQMELLDLAQAVGVFQITFTDLDLSVFPAPPGSIIYLFAYNGLVDINLKSKPALSAWDHARARPPPP
jgi:hypothetical protein